LRSDFNVNTEAGAAKDRQAVSPAYDRAHVKKDPARPA
jgi:hypothetical protein